MSSATPPADPPAVRVAVVGHVEWCEFVRVERLPRSGDIAHALEWWAEPAGGGAVSAVQLARLAGEADFFTALGDDELGRRAREGLESLGVTVHAATRHEPTRRAVVFLDDFGERTITVLGDKLVPRARDRRLPWDRLAATDGVYFVSGDVGTLRAVRRARVVVATPRELPTLRKSGIALDAVVGSGDDEGERFHAGDLDPPPRLVVATAGPLGGWAQPGGPYRAVPPAEPFVDTYGAGDSFAAGLTFALAEGRAGGDAVAFAAACGAEALTRRGAHG
jgi:ribokinase